MNSSQTPSQISSLSPRATSAFRASIVLATAFIATFGLYVYLYLQNNAWQLGVLIVISFIVSAFNIAALIFSRKGRVEMASALMIAGMVILLPIAASLVSGIGLVLGVGGVLGIFMIAALTLTQPNLNRALLVGIILGTGTILLDIFPLQD